MPLTTYTLYVMGLELIFALTVKSLKFFWRLKAKYGVDLFLTSIIVITICDVTTLVANFSDLSH